jgi:hypothetical protein
MVNSRLGPGTWMNRIEEMRKASHWWDVGICPVSTIQAARVTSL